MDTQITSRRNHGEVRSVSCNCFHHTELENTYGDSKCFSVDKNLNQSLSWHFNAEIKFVMICRAEQIIFIISVTLWHAHFYSFIIWQAHWIAHSAVVKTINNHVGLKLLVEINFSTWVSSYINLNPTPRLKFIIFWRAALLWETTSRVK